MKKTKLSTFEVLDSLIPVGSLDRDGLALYRSLAASRDDSEVRAGVVRLLEDLCDAGRLARLSRSEVDGETRLRYRDLESLDTIAISLPREAEEPARGTGGAPDAAPTETETAGTEMEQASEPPVEATDRVETPDRIETTLPGITPAILEAVAAASRRIDLAGALDHLYDLLHEVVGYDKIAIYKSKGLSNSPAGVLTELEEVYRWSEDYRVCPNVLKSRIEEEGHTVHLPNIPNSDRYARYFPKGLGGSLLVAPLKAEGYVYGVLELWRQLPDAYDQNDVAVVGFVSEFASGLIKRRLEIEELIFVDHTSQIHNRRYFDEQLTREIARCKRSNNSLALLVADLDDFKKVNDTLGHAAGDSVLRQVARIFSENARQVDIVARYGGEEFVVILPDVTRESAAAVAERIRSAIESHRFITGLADDPTRELTISIGGALYPLDAESRADLIDKADRLALYEAKRAGKNRIVFWKDIQSH